MAERERIRFHVRGLIPVPNKPFVFIREVEIKEPGIKGEVLIADLTRKRFSYIERDFPLEGGKVPAMILGEAMAEAFGSVAFSKEIPDYGEGLLATAGLRIPTTIYRGEEVLLKAEVVRGRSRTKYGHVKALRDGELVAVMEILVVVGDQDPTARSTP